MPSLTATFCAAKDRFCSRRCALVAVRNQLAHLERLGRRRPPLTVFCCAACDGGWHVGGSDLTRPRHARRGTY